MNEQYLIPGTATLSNGRAFGLNLQFVDQLPKLLRRRDFGRNAVFEVPQNAVRQVEKLLDSFIQGPGSRIGAGQLRMQLAT